MQQFPSIERAGGIGGKANRSVRISNEEGKTKRAANGTETRRRHVERALSPYISVNKV